MKTLLHSLHRFLSALEKKSLSSRNKNENISIQEFSEKSQDNNRNLLFDGS